VTASINNRPQTYKDPLNIVLVFGGRKIRFSKPNLKESSADVNLFYLSQAPVNSLPYFLKGKPKNGRPQLSLEFLRLLREFGRRF